MFKRPPPTIEETVERITKMSSGSTSKWSQISKLKVDQPTDDHRGSVQLSVMSDESRRQSIFAEEDVKSIILDAAESDIISELEEEEKKKRSPQDEVFVDKARAAMVVIGTKDIKESLEHKKAEEILKKTPEAKNANILYHQSRFLMHQNRFREALMFLDRALTADAERKEWLTDKSRCCLYLLQPEVALQCVDQVLKKDPKYFRAVLLKGEILYALWDLERSMLCFVEGRRMRPDDTQCIEGMHKVRMALEEMAAHRFPTSSRKRKLSKKRSKSAKGRLTSVPPSEGFLSPMRERSLSSRRPSSRLSLLPSKYYAPSSVTRVESPVYPARPSTAAPRRRVESPSVSRSQKSDVGRPPSLKESNKNTLARPKTAANRRSRSKSTPRDPEIDEIRRFVKESMSGSYRSSPLRCLSGSTQRSARSGFSDASFSSSMEDVSENSGGTMAGTHRLPKVKMKSKSNVLHPRNRTAPKTNIHASLRQDKVFLDGLLKDKDLKRSQTIYTKRVLRIVREVQTFVTEREKYWKDRELFVRHATSDEDTFL